MFNTNLLATLFAFVLAVVSLQGMQAESVCEHYTLTSLEKDVERSFGPGAPFGNVTDNAFAPTTGAQFGNVTDNAFAPTTGAPVGDVPEKGVSKLEQAIMRQTGTASYQGLRSLKSKYREGADMLRGSLKIQPLTRCEMNYLPVRETDVVQGYFQ
jgi:hypothetical protein